jgi:UDP-glucose 4-epimerase
MKPPKHLGKYTPNANGIRIPIRHPPAGKPVRFQITYSNTLRITHMTKVAVTGGAGFIGSFLCRSLIADGHSVIVIDNLSTGDVKNVPKAVQFIQGSCENEGDLLRLKDKKFEAIFHLAGQSSGEISFDNPILDMDANVKSTLVLLKFAKEVGCKKFIYASSMSVYGDPISLPVYEEMETKPKSFYAVGKLASEN